MSDPALRRIVPLPPIGSEVFQTYEVAHEFYEEVRHREQLEDYCQWYREIAAQNRRDLQQMRGETNLFGWFCRGRGTN
ncbi:hypothetical protein H6F67_01960 [Microcoleus sp. FACHB-1515]|uniref:hypothetical protein n=1 Tax=Cyanophyceae TaxID=3028117 RepID=UPI001689A87C|nr:hypothetical protein [Microcoleus sp. FACHB-1515]MBD2088624.1 hypothetical protein [Microcoleus sp. FACHB-1515]